MVMPREGEGKRWMGRLGRRLVAADAVQVGEGNEAVVGKVSSWRKRKMGRAK